MSDVQNYVPIIPSGLESLREYQGVVSQVLTEKVATHDPKDGLTLLEENLSQYPFQDVRCTSVVGSNAGSDKLRYYASKVYPQQDQIIEAFLKRPSLLQEVYDQANLGGNFGLITDHPKVIATLILGTSFLAAMYEKGYFSPGDIEVVLFANAMIKYTMLREFMPTTEVIADVVSKTLYTHPDNTDGSEELEIPKAVRKAVNTENLKDLLLMQKDPKPLFSILAGSGKRDFSTIDPCTKQEVIHLGPMNNATAGIVSKLWTIPMGLDISGDQPVFYVGNMREPFGRKDRKNSGDSIMLEIAEGMTAVSGIRRIYHSNYATFKAVLETFRVA